MTKLHHKKGEDFINQKESDLEKNPILLSLWLDAKDNWEKAHDQVDQLEGKDAARIHAYLHRKEGDQWNADYWYRRAGEARPNMTLDEEWEYLVERYYGLG
ncbi:hypothetical protein SAMN04488104_100323 [Algoriphagus faecimaris]|uniref:Uncharacterized protein n=1 Tax=Algoriphagus faecimaris TaxID=686796 RepID=A0A1G6N8N0_9BACT|nr:hypothetical protein [Algoriphagus faecimaris]SDC64198.1 hypothetical protein SAMN04488104_100323 [Algoriphagus faecimaris]